MKNTVFKLINLSLLFLTTAIMAQGPPGPPGGHGSGDDESPAGAPTGSGVSILIGMGILYGGRKLYILSKDTT